MSKMMRITALTSTYLDQLSQEVEISKQDLIEKAVKLLVKQHFLERTNRQYEELRKDKKAHEALLKERAEWDASLSDGLDDKPWQD